MIQIIKVIKDTNKKETTRFMEFMDIDEALEVVESENSSVKEKETAIDFPGSQHNTPQAKTILSVLLMNLNYPDEGVQFHILMALENYPKVEGAEAAIQPLIEYLVDEDKERIHDEGCYGECYGEAATVPGCYAKAQVAGSELAIEQLLQTMWKNNGYIYAPSMEALGGFAWSPQAPRIIQTVIKSLGEEYYWERRGCAVYMLANFANVPGIEAALEPISKLTGLKAGGLPCLQLTAIWGLGELGSVALIPVLQAHLQDNNSASFTFPGEQDSRQVTVGEMAQYAIQRIKERAGILEE